MQFMFMFVYIHLSIIQSRLVMNLNSKTAFKFAREFNIRKPEQA